MRIDMKARLRRATTPKNGVPMQNHYYESVSVGLGILQVVLYLSLFAFVVLSFFRNTQLITYQTFYHFIKDLNASAESVFDATSDTVSYPTDDQQSFTLYRQGLAVAGNANVTVFTASGRQTVSQNIQYQNPTAIGSGKYLLVYELGGTQYSLYNSYTKIHEGVSDHPINHAAISESGMFALVSASEGYTSTVSLYSSRFSLLNRYHKSGYVMDVAINKRGTQVSILSIAPQNGSFTTEWMLCKPGEDSAQVTKQFLSRVGWRCEYTASDRIVLLHEAGVSFFDSDGKALQEYDFQGKTLLFVDFDTAGTAICLQGTAFFSKKELIVFDKNGKILYNEMEPETPLQMDLIGQTLFFLSEDGVIRLDLKNADRTFVACATAQKTLLATTEEEVLLCSPHQGEYLRFP
ncbi:MAG: hypothetical protein IJX28_03580 [Clostridia bacterium]|nr:hypothetical protein [Clostridia bacterium]